MVAFPTTPVRIGTASAEGGATTQLVVPTVGPSSGAYPLRFSAPWKVVQPIADARAFPA